MWVTHAHGNFINATASSTHYLLFKTPVYTSSVEFDTPSCHPCSKELKKHTQFSYLPFYPHNKPIRKSLTVIVITQYTVS